MTNAIVKRIAIVRKGPMVRMATVAKSRELPLSARASPTRNSPILSFISISIFFMSQLSVGRAGPVKMPDSPRGSD